MQTVRPGWNDPGHDAAAWHRRPDVGDEAAIAAMRPAITAALGQASDGTVPLPGGWPVRYAAPHRLACA
jgi:hypothetical protein